MYAFGYNENININISGYLMKKLLSLCLLWLVILQVCFLSGCKAGANREKFTDYSFDYFDTVTTIIGYEKSEKVFKENCEKIKEQLYEYHKLYTIYTRYEGINNLCSINALSDGTHTEQTVDERIIEMLEFSKEMYTLTNGRVNIAMGSVLSIWHNYRQRGTNDPAKAELPDIKDLEAAAVHTDINDLVIDKENKTVFLIDDEMSLDVGAIAKGYAVEDVALWMKKQGMDGYVLNVGGNVRTVGTKPDGKNWTVGIENPDTDNQDEPYIAYLEFSDMALVTSGSYQRFYMVDGKSYHHIIDPDTLMPGEKYLSVSVLCESSAKADALSTALFTMSFDDGKALVEGLENTEAMWVLHDGSQKYSSGFSKYVSEQ